MRPTSTSYRLIADYDYYSPQIDALWAATDIPQFPTVHPQIVAERGGKVIGFVARRHDEGSQAVIIEPILAPSMIVYIRLIEAIERVMKAAGVESYYFRVEPHRINHLKILKNGGTKFVTDLGYHSGFHWFRRAI